MQKIKLNKQSILFIAASLVLLIELAVLLPVGIKKISKTTAAIKTLKQKINTIETEWPRKENYLQQAEALEETTNNYKQKAIQQGQESRLISFISKNSKQYNLKIKSITPLGPLPTKNDNFEFVPYRVQAEASFHDLGNFFQFLQSSNYFFSVKELTLSGWRPIKINILLCGLQQKKE